MEHTADTPHTEAATEAAASHPPQLSAHERQLIVQYRAATEATRAHVRQMLDPPISD
jgi:hypothetical protein